MTGLGSDSLNRWVRAVHFSCGFRACRKYVADGVRGLGSLMEPSYPSPACLAVSHAGTASQLAGDGDNPSGNPPARSAGAGHGGGDHFQKSL